MYEILNDNFLPDILKMFEDQEKEERLKLLMANKRSSSRLDRKRDMEEQAFMKRMEEEIRLEMERSTEEAKRKQRDLDALMANRKRIIAVGV